MEMTEWRYWLDTAQTLRDMENGNQALNDWRKALRAKLNDEKLSRGAQGAIYHAMDDAIDYAQFEASTQWAGPWESGAPHTPECLASYARQLDEHAAMRERETAWLAKYGKTHCPMCHGYGMFHDSGDFYTPPSDEVCDQCLGREMPVSPESEQYTPAPLCPQCGGERTIRFGDNTDATCDACGWRLGDGYPDDGGAYPECACPSR